MKTYTSQAITTLIMKYFCQAEIYGTLYIPSKIYTGGLNLID